MFDDDFSFLTGKQADLDNDGKVSFGEYMNDCDDFNRIYRNTNHSTGRYKPQQQHTEGKPIGMVGWILILICCFTPIFSSIVNAGMNISFLTMFSTHGIFTFSLSLHS